MPDAVVHKIVSLVLAVLLLVQYAPLYSVHPAGDTPGSMHGEAQAHEAGAYCLRHADGEKCPHHQPSQHQSTQHQPSHGAHARPHAEPEGTKICPCNHNRPFVAPVIVVDKVVLGATSDVLLAASSDWHFLPAKTLVVERFANEHFHPPPSVS